MADDVITAADLQKWRHSSATSELVDGSLRVRVQTQPRGAWGTIGNYNNSAPETLVKLPFKPSVVKDLRAGKTISAGQNFKFNVPRSDIRLFYLKK